ncbi:MAG: glycosyltransferase family 2 protein, partial [Alphaproteobacteria bacterium]
MARLRIHLYVHCWNEETILPHLFRHHSFVERFVVYDNHSTDATPAIVAAEPRAELRRFDTGETADMDAYLRIKNGAWKESRGRADLVIVCDADEFLFHPALDDVLARMRAEDATVLKPAGFDMIGTRAPGPDEDLLRLVPDGARKREFDKCI